VVRVPFSRYNREYDERESPWLLRDDFHTRLIPTPWYDGGFLVKGQAAAAPFISADWQAGIISGLGDEISGGRGLEKALPSGMAFNRSNALCGNLGLKILDHAEVTLSGYTGAVDIYDRHDLDMGLLAFSLIFKHVSFDAGVMDARIDSLINSSGDTLPVAMQGSFTEIRGHYSWPRLGLLTLALRWEDLDLDKTGRAPDMIGFPSQRRAFGLGLSLSPRPGLVFKAEFRSPRNKGDLLNSGNINDDLFLLGVALGPEYLKNKAHEKP
jgi:hypothetical protein